MKTCMYKSVGGMGVKTCMYQSVGGMGVKTCNIFLFAPKNPATNVP